MNVPRGAGHRRPRIPWLRSHKAQKFKDEPLVIFLWSVHEHQHMSVELVDIGLRDVDACGALQFDKPIFMPGSNARRRGVVIDATHPVFAFYHGFECAKPFRLKIEFKPPAAPGWLMFGTILLQLSHDAKKGLTVSVEAASLIKLLMSKETVADAPEWSFSSRDGMCFAAAFNGWRGAIAEFRLWVALWWHLEPALPRPEVEATGPMIRAWYDVEVLNDFVKCMGMARVLELMSIVADNGYLGSPDLVLWKMGAVEFAEIKSSTDALRPEQDRCLRHLARLASTSVYCTADIRLAEKRCRPSGKDSDSSDSN